MANNITFLNDAYGVRVDDTPVGHFAQAPLWHLSTVRLHATSSYIAARGKFSATAYFTIMRAFAAASTPSTGTDGIHLRRRMRC